MRTVPSASAQDALVLTLETQHLKDLTTAFIALFVVLSVQKEPPYSTDWGVGCGAPWPTGTHAEDIRPVTGAHFYALT